MRGIMLFGALMIVILCLLSYGFETAQMVMHAPTPGAPQLTQAAFQVLAQADQANAERTAEADRGATQIAVELYQVNAEGTARAAEETAQAIRAQQTSDAFAIQAQTEAAGRYYAQLTAEARSAAQTAEARSIAETQAAYTAQTAEAARAGTQQAQHIINLTVTADIAISTQAAQANAQATIDARTAIAKTETVANAQLTQTASAQATAAGYEDQLKQAAMRRQELVNSISALWPYLVGTACIIAALAGLWLLYPVLASRLRDRMPDAAGNYPLVADRFGNVYNPARNPYPIAQLGPRPDIPLLTPPAMQERTTLRAQVVEALAKMQAGGARPNFTQLWERMGMDNQPAALPAPEPLPNSAPWQLLNDWRGGGFALGVGEQGLIQLDPESPAPHLLMAGTSGSGKSRYGVRSILPQALADRWQVIIFDRSGVDFQPFAQHPNARLVRIDEPEQVVGYLKLAYKEIIRRLRMLAAANISTWGRWDNREPRLMIVIDEFSNLADDMDGGGKEELWKRARMIAAEGRKAGVLLLLALQDPTHKSIDLRIRRNATGMAFKVQDSEASRVILGTDGAEKLPKQHFLTVIGGLQHGVAFCPSDDDIARFLDARPVPAYPAPAWLEAGPEEEGESQEEIIRRLHSEGLSLNKIQQQVFGFTGGAAYAAVKLALEGSTTSTTTGSTGTDTAAWVTN